MGPATFVQIEEDKDSGGFFFFYLNDQGVSFADSWFLSLEDAKESGRSQFGIEEQDCVKSKNYQVKAGAERPKSTATPGTG